jgi:N-acetylmuramoyl-L-alanine amidase
MRQAQKATFRRLANLRWPTVAIWARALPACLLCLSASGAVPPAAAQESGKKSIFDTVITRSRPPEPPRPAARKPLVPPGEPQSSAASSLPVPEISAHPTGQPADKADPSEAVDTTRAAGPAHATVVRQAEVVTADRNTHFRMSLSQGVRAEIFTLANPYRVIIDLPDVDFRLEPGAGRTGDGLISAFRYGLFAERKGRVVVDATGPVRIEKARMTSTGTGASVVLDIEMQPISAEEFGQGTGAGAQPQVATRPSLHEDNLPAAPASAQPLVLIDPGHGGIDPGAIGEANVVEKALVLGVAQKLRRRLEASGRYRVAMTRAKDVFVSLDQRVKLSRKLQADLFISLHADAIASKAFAQVVRGATVYTLSDRASDEQARLMAEKENASDLMAGIDTSATDEGNEAVRTILIDLMKRETSNFSMDFSNHLVKELRRHVSMSKEPQRAAAFKVLKQPHAPSVLVELGYMSNADDARLMREAEWQSKVSQSITAAVDAFFAKRTIGTGP